METYFTPKIDKNLPTIQTGFSKLQKINVKQIDKSFNPKIDGNENSEAIFLDENDEDILLFFPSEWYVEGDYIDHIKDLNLNIIQNEEWDQELLDECIVVLWKENMKVKTCLGSEVELSAI